MELLLSDDDDGRVESWLAISKKLISFFTGFCRSKLHFPLSLSLSVFLFNIRSDLNILVLSWVHPQVILCFSLSNWPVDFLEPPPPIIICVMQQFIILNRDSARSKRKKKKKRAQLWLWVVLNFFSYMLICYYWNRTERPPPPHSDRCLLIRDKIHILECLCA